MKILDTDTQTEICAMCGELIENFEPLIILGRGEITLKREDRNLLVLHRRCLAQFKFETFLP